MATMTVLNSVGGTETVEKPLAPGRAAAGAARPVALCTEDFAVIDGLEGSLSTIATNTGVQFGAGITTATTQRMVISSDQLDPSVAHDAADSGAPIKIGLKASSSLSGLTLVADADRTNAFAGLDGVQITRPHCNLEDIVSTGTFTDTAGSSTSFVVSSGAGVKTYLTSIILCNTSATNVVVAIKDGTTTKITLPVPATSGCVFNPPVPIPGTAATAWNFHPSAAATTIHCSGIGFKSKV